MESEPDAALQYWRVFPDANRVQFARRRRSRMDPL